MGRAITVCLAGLLCLAGLAAKDKPGKGHGKGHAENGGVSVGFSMSDRGIIEEFYRPGGGLPPGLAKRGGALPPGLEKQLVKKGQLPPGLQKKLEPFPTELEQRLPPLLPGYRRGTIGVNVVLWNEKMNLVVDILKLAGR